eukprot:TRINITY_DN2763_c0_g5_i1.p3 TRINITY_DN2763_c0_g5~~TRINITY_DN2763_c0_g5_i1.p3  ORF type:complete len:132 (+),score=13.11 TRINITY_DN2763_c0_g5_i1:7-402(+)
MQTPFLPPSRTMGAPGRDSDDSKRTFSGPVVAPLSLSSLVLQPFVTGVFMGVGYAVATEFTRRMIPRWDNRPWWFMRMPGSYAAHMRDLGERVSLQARVEKLEAFMDGMSRSQQQRPSLLYGVGSFMVLLG